MVTTKHICDVCGKSFPKSRLEEAKEHEKISIVERDYHGVIMRYKDKYHNQYIFLVKSDKLSQNHERIYNHSIMDVSELELTKYGANNLIHLPSCSKWSISDIETMIQNKNLQSISNEELGKINNLRNQNFIDDWYTQHYQGMWKSS